MVIEGWFRCMTNIIVIIYTFLLKHELSTLSPNQGLANILFSLKDQMVNILSFVVQEAQNEGIM